MAHLRLQNGHIGKTLGSTAHLSRCGQSPPTTVCRCLDATETEIDRPDIIATVGGSMSSTALTVCTPSPVDPGSCPAILASYTVACNGSGGTVCDTSTGNVLRVFVCGTYWYYACVTVDFNASLGTPADSVDIEVQSGYIADLGGGVWSGLAVQRFRDEYEFSTRVNCDAPTFKQRVWITGESATNDCCLINSVTTSVANV